MMDANTTAAVVSASVAVVAMTAGVVRPLFKLVRDNKQFREDWYGQPERAGFPPIPGVPERLRHIEVQLTQHINEHKGK